MSNRLVSTEDSKMKHTIHLLALLSTCLTAAPSPAGEMQDPWFEAFRNPPAEAKPFVRWWWNGLRLREDEVIRQLDLLKYAGIGGIEINPIAQPPGSKALKDPEVEWLSPEWARMVRFTVDEAKKHGIITDLIVGSGWPFGAEFLEEKHMTQRMATAWFEIKGPQVFEAKVPELLSRVSFMDEERHWEAAPQPVLHSVTLAPETPRSIHEAIDVTSQIRDGKLRIDIPKGKHRIHVVALQRGFSSVVLGAPGARGPVLDHFNQEAVESFLKRMSDALNPAFDGRFGGPVRAVFCDSLELSRANWSDDFEAEFRKRNGYELRPWMPFILDFGNAPPVAPEMANAVGRARHDFSRLLVDLFQERFVEPYHAWCHAHGALSRYQSYGSPWHLGLLEGFMKTDIPEANNWLFSWGYRRHGFRVWIKYATSAAHLAGKRIVSVESMTNSRGVFRADLQLIKAADDLNFISGVSHSVLHGFNYSPPEAGFPGWVRYGTYFSEHNPWWPQLPNWTAYNARLSALFQNTTPVVSTAAIAPMADLWSQHGLNRDPFHIRPWYAHRLWETLSNCGSNTDYITDAILQGATYHQGALHFGPASYRTLILCDSNRIDPASAEALARHVAAGGQLVLVGATPEKSAAMVDAGAMDQRVREALQKIRESGGKRVIEIDPPADQAAFLEWTKELLKRLDDARTVVIRNPDEAVFFTHRRDAAGRDVLFFANAADERKTLDLAIKLPGTPVRWNPETGARHAFPLNGSLVLDAYESLLLVFESGNASAVKTAPAALPAPDAPGTGISGPWALTLEPITGESQSFELDKLQDFAESDDPRLNTFAGIAVYRKTLDPGQSSPEWLDLGSVHGTSSVTLNGTPLGTRWYGRHTYPIANAVRPGKNKLEIRVATTPFNHARTLRDDPAAARWIPDDIAGKPLPAGIAGPIHLID